MMRYNLNTKRAQVTSLLIVLAIMALLGGGAYVMSKGSGSEISGAIVISGSCPYVANQTNTIYTLLNILTCSANQNGINITADGVTIDCSGGGKIVGDTSGGTVTGIDANTYDNITIKNCDISKFRYGVQLSNASSWTKVLNNYIHDMTSYAIRADNMTKLNISGNTFEDTSNGTGGLPAILLYDVDYSNISRNSFSGTGEYDIFLNSDCYGTNVSFNSFNSTEPNIIVAGNSNHITRNDFATTVASSSLEISGNSNKIWLNNFSSEGINDSGSGNQYCAQESDSQQINYFGNYYDSDISDSYKGTSCSGLSYGWSLPLPVEDALPTLCGATVIGALTLTENLMNHTDAEDATCAGDGLVIGSDGASIECADFSINGTFGGTGIKINGYDNIDVSDCWVSNFTNTIKITDADNLGISSNHVSNSGKHGIDVDSTNNSHFTGNTITSSAWSGFALNQDSSNMVTDSNFTNNIIYDNNHHGFHIGHTSGVNISGNNINGSQDGKYGIYLTTGATNNNISKNTIDYSGSGSFDLETDAGSGNSIYLNDFYGTGVSESVDNMYCVANKGNFYKDTVPLSAIGPGDCGPIVVDMPFNHSQTYGFYNVSYLNINWTPQSSQNSISYYVNVNDTTDDTQTQEYYGSNKYHKWNTTLIIENSSFKLVVNPYDGTYNGTYNNSVELTVSNDMDNDFYSVLDYYKAFDSWDCDESNSSIHQPKTRENITDPYVDDVCYNTVDDDCDGNSTKSGIDWMDYGCGEGFTTKKFNITLYINGTIEELSRSLVKDTLNTFYILIEDKYGKIEYFTETNLSGVDLDTIFNITHGRASSLPDAYDGRFNKSAKVTFYNLSEYHKVPVVLVDGEPCTPETTGICTGFDPQQSMLGVAKWSANKNISFNVAHFSVFNATSNSRLETFTHNDTWAGGLSSNFPKAIETYQRVRFYANYTRFPDNVSINNRTPSGGSDDTYHNGTCNITIYYPNGTAIQGSNNAMMLYDSFYGVYWFETGVFNFTVPSAYYVYNITCESNLYEPINLTENFKVTEDVTPPIRPVLYPQILVYPTNLTANNWTWVAGYFNESDINYSIVVLHGFWTWNFNGTTDYTDDHSEYKGDDIIVNFASTKGQNVTFTAWNPTVEKALGQFHYMEFSNHNRTYFRRYYIDRANRTGDDIRIETNETLEEDIPMGTSIQLYNSPYPSGYFMKNVSMFSGTNRIGVWGVDQAGNSGNATHDWVNAPYLDTAPNASTLWPLPEAIRSDVFELYMIGHLFEPTNNLNMTINVIQGDYYNITDSTTFVNSHVAAAASVTQDRPAGSDYFTISYFDYSTINSSMNWTESWVEFSNHNRSYWFRYNITQNATKPPGQDARVYISPNLTVNMSNGTLASFFNASLPQGWFNITVTVDKLVPGNNTIYAVGFRGSNEGYPSDYQYVYKDSTPPTFNLSTVQNYSNTRTPTIRFNVTDDYKVNISDIIVMIRNSTTWNRTYTYNSTALNHTDLNFTANMSCTDVYGNKSLYDCSFTLNRTENGTYNVTYSIYDFAGWKNFTWKNLTILVTSVDIYDVYDEDDITNDLWMNFSWTASSGELFCYEYAFGTAKYPDSGWDSIKNWTNMSNATGDCTQTWVNFTHDTNASDINATELKMKTGTVYYLTVRAQNLAGDYGENKSSDGILFIDPSPPIFRYVNDTGPWTNSRTSLKASWLFEDNESDIIEYTYAIGNASYPNLGYNSVIPATTITSASVVRDSLNLTENSTYYVSVKARNGNSAVNYSGSWSPWYSSGGVQVDTYPPSGGFILWTNASYITSGFVTVQYDVGSDDPGASDNVKGMIQYGRSPLVYDYCPGITDFDWYNSSDILPTGSSYRDVNVSSGYCYVFRLYAWDNASNGVTYIMVNETLRIVKIDQTPPTVVSPVLDDGFFTNDRSSLHASWVGSNDSESGFSHYYWAIIEEPVAGAGFCNMSAGGTNCTPVRSGNTTATEISINTLNLTHNHKYYFLVRAWNRAGLNSTTGYSDGIIYIDNAPPEPVTIYMMNEDNESDSPYYTWTNTSVINITAYGDLDGFIDIDRCMLLSDDIDYEENTTYTSVLSKCSVRQVESNITNFSYALVNYSYRIITEVNCTNYTNYTGLTNATQGNWTWYVSCRDPYWNLQSSAQNTPVWFAVDWPEPPLMNATIGNSSLLTLFNKSLARPVYSDDDLYCEGLIWEPDNYPGSELNSSNITVTWKKNGQMIDRHYVSASDPELDGIYNVSDTLSYNWTYRGNNITCEFNATDELNLSGINSTSIMISNSPPYGLLMLSPDVEVVNGMMYFSWVGPYDDVDNDSMVLQIVVDNETIFNNSNTPALEFAAPVMLSVGDAAIPGEQYNPDIYGRMIVYEDNRTGLGLDIYLYDIDSDTDTVIAISSDVEFNPQVYGDYVLYEKDIGGGMSAVYRYSIDTAVTSLLISSIRSGSMDYFGKYVVYSDGAGVRMFNVLEGGSAISIPDSGASSTDISTHGNNVVWTDGSGNIWLYDHSNRSSYDTGLDGVGRLFGANLAGEYGGQINLTNLAGGSSFNISGLEHSMYGKLLVYSNGTHVNVADLGAVHYNISLGEGWMPAVYDKIIAFVNGSDIYYALMNESVPANLVFENPVSASFVYKLNTSYSKDGAYSWMITACDNSFSNNSCIVGYNHTDPTDSEASNFTNFTIDNTPPVILGVSPSDGSIVAGQFRIYADIVDNTTGVSYANYTIWYRTNMTVRSSGNLSASGSLWSSEQLDFLDINVTNFTMQVMANDSRDNWNTVYVNFTVNNNTPWFLFGGRGGTEIITNVTIFNDSIDSDFVAFTVNYSTLRIVGPIPSTSVRFVQSKSNTSVTNHNYSDTISTLTWPDGMYITYMNGTNHDGNTNGSRAFYVDHNVPLWSRNMTWPNATFAFANQSLMLSINWSDATLRQVNFTYNNTNISNSTEQIQTFNGTLASGQRNSSAIDVRMYINRTFYWWSSAKDGLNRTNSTAITAIFSVFIQDNAPVTTGNISDIATYEDTIDTAISLDLSSYFSDLNDAGALGYLDNLTYYIYHNCSNVAFYINNTSGKLLNITSSNNYTGNCTAYVNATDSFGKWNASNNFTLSVLPVNDPPTISPLPVMYTDEDNSSTHIYQLSSYVYDIDGDNVTYLSPLYNSSALNLTGYNLTEGEFNFSQLPDVFGVYNITFRISDGTLTTSRYAQMLVNSINDAPVPGNFTMPSVNETKKGRFELRWNPATDKVNEHQALTYYLAYSPNGGTSWSEIVNYSVLQGNNSYRWNSSAFIPGEANVTLRLNVSDGMNTSMVAHGNFTVDNLAPQLTINLPVPIVVGSSFTTDIRTHEIANCSFGINGSAVLSSSQTTNTAVHNVLVSGMAYNRTYLLSMSCNDAVGNVNSSSYSFQARQNPVEFQDIFAVPSWVYQNQPVNMTLEVFSNTTLNTVSIRLLWPGGSQDLNSTDFAPALDEYNYITNVTVVPSAIGIYNVSIDLLRNADNGQQGPLTRIDNLFEVFAAVNQTLNLL